MVKVNNRKAKQIQNGMEAIFSAATPDKEQALEKKDCVDDSEGGGFALMGNAPVARSR